MHETISRCIQPVSQIDTTVFGKWYVDSHAFYPQRLPNISRALRLPAASTTCWKSRDNEQERSSDKRSASDLPTFSEKLSAYHTIHAWAYQQLYVIFSRSTWTGWQWVRKVYGSQANPVQPPSLIDLSVSARNRSTSGGGSHGRKRTRVPRAAGLLHRRYHVVGLGWQLVLCHWWHRLTGQFDRWHGPCVCITYPGSFHSGQFENFPGAEF